MKAKHFSRLRNLSKLALFKFKEYRGVRSKALLFFQDIRIIFCYLFFSMTLSERQIYNRIKKEGGVRITIIHNMAVATNKTREKIKMFLKSPPKSLTHIDEGTGCLVLSFSSPVEYKDYLAQHGEYHH